MIRSFSILLLAVVVAGCSTGRMNEPSLTGELGLDASMLSANKTIVENAAGQPELSSLVAAVQRAGLVDALSGPGPFTVFAPINAAFDGMDLSAIDPADLGAVLQYHVISGDFKASELADGMILEGLDGNELVVSTRTTGDPGFMIDDADIIFTDIEASNGTIHLINLVLNPTEGGMAR
ncbi:fasciclin domain-containing protein [Rubrivirga sp.]|uniref:fasciclin domain-containing protein n=1 Tax=Rubrivirga sp. TaxID=1885344 RepID=UPI003C75E0EC